ncbi:fibroblast growth factor receptor 3-like [Amphiura filiformis]|uniref:fibroblast growth factor receptor 3-like n=1 Tax=Amphiura filiformis TaxID=82378 RepID=UPI003B220818
MIPLSTLFHEEEKEEKVEPVFAQLEMDRSMLTIEDELGSGQFGVVYKGFALGVGGNKTKYIPVAVKGLKKNANQSIKEDFLDEIKLIIEIGSHPNILSIFGCITVDEPYYLVTEFMEYGDLLHFLWRCREEEYMSADPIYNMTDVAKLQIAHQITRGMEYLSQTRYYHGDLAARNILVGKDLVVKISDFGMAEDIYMREYKRMAPERKRAVKWVSLETNTTGRCTIKSDVWSFGIVLFEIYTLGGVPYPTMDAQTVLDKLLTGYRMEKPTNCPNDVYDVMLKCWSEKPDDRPHFRELYLTFDKMLASHSVYMGGFEVMDDVFDKKKTPDDVYVMSNLQKEDTTR